MAKASGITSYSDRFGLIQPYAGEPAITSRHGPLQTVEWFFALTRLEQKRVLPKIKTILSNLEIETENGAVTTCYPNSRTTDMIENAIALIVFSELFDDGRLSKRLYRHGELTRATKIDSTQSPQTNLRFYPLAWLLSGFSIPNRFYNTRPNEWSFDSWWGKAPSFVGLLELSAVDRTSFFKKTMLLVYLFASLLETEPPFFKKRLSIIIWSWLKRRGKIWGLSFFLWNAIFKISEPEGAASLYRKIYPQEHPINL